METSSALEVLWRANQGPQTRFLASTAFEALYGGAAGGGKSDALLMGALRYVHVPSYRGLLLRRTFPELQRSLIPKSFLRYLPIGGKPIMSSSPHWKFPSGAIIEFGHLQHEHDVHNYQSAEYQYIAFDELTSFLESQYVYLQSRLRSTAGVPLRIRAGTNPGGVGHEWVQKRFAPWLLPDSPTKAAPGEKLYYVNTKDGPQLATKESAGALSRVFFPARVSDNPHIDSGYEDILRGLDPVSRAQLLDGDWLARPVSGAYFKRAHLKVIQVMPPDVVARVRRWDLASTEDGGDWTVGVKLAWLKDGKFVVEDVVRVRLAPRGVRATVKNTAELDGQACEIVIPQDPGQAGKDQVEEYTTMLAGYTVRTKPETGDKVMRAGPASAQWEAGNISLLKGPWNEPFMQSLEAFPDPGAHDDDVDALAGAVSHLSLSKPSTFSRWASASL